MVLEFQIIVSYVKSDNVPGSSGNGWVMLFAKYLGATFKQMTGTQPAIVFHAEGEVNELNDYSQNTVMVMIISPDFLKSGWCEKALDITKTFVYQTDEYNKRIYKVVKAPVEVSKYPELIRNIIPYNFFTEKEGGKHKELQNEWHNDLWIKMVDLAYAIKEIYGESAGQVEKEGNDNSQIKTIYLAETGSDMTMHREIIHRELIRHNIKVKPAFTLPRDIAELEHKVKDEMESCDLSIHLIGEDYGDTPKGTDRSVVDIQNKIAVEISSLPFKDKYATTKQLSRLVWIAPEINKVSEKQKLFIENIKRDNRALKEDELLQVPFDELKEIIQNKLINKGQDAHAPFAIPKKGKSSIYLIYDRIDLDVSKQLSDYFTKKGHTVIHSNFEGDQISVRMKHEANLRICDATLIICGEVNLEWVNIKLQDLIKAPGFGRITPFKAKALYIENEKFYSYHPSLLNLDDSIILESTPKLIPENVNLFLSKLTA